jgi:hypothetical protein
MNNSHLERDTVALAFGFKLREPRSENTLAFEARDSRIDQGTHLAFAAGERGCRSITMLSCRSRGALCLVFEGRAVR